MELMELTFTAKIKVPATMKTNEMLGLGASLEEIFVNGVDAEYSDVSVESSKIERS